MRLLKCPKCGEMFSDTYKTCPFCQEDEELHSDKPVKHSHRRTGGGRAKPKVGGVAVVVCLVLVLGLAAYTIFGSQLKDIFGGKKNVEPQPDTQTLTLSQSSVELAVGNSVVLSATGADKITFSSSDEGVATVTVDGTVKAVGAGSAVITVKAAEQAATCRVTVTAPASEDPVTPDTPDTPVTPDTPSDLAIYSAYGKNVVTDVTIEAGKEALMKVQGTDSAVTWSIADSSIATVDSSGMVKGVASGVTTLTATVDGQTLTCIVRVN